MPSAFDQRSLDRLKPSCARILRPDRSLRGTGFLVSDDLVATCRHVIEDAGDQRSQVVCRFGDVDPVEREGEVLRWDARRDTALVKLETPAPAAPIPLGGDASDLAWYAYGFPAFAEALGIPLYGHVLDAHTVDKEGRPACSLHVEPFAGDLPDSVGGFSGSPVLSDGKVIGTIFRVLGAADGWQRPHLGMCFATPVWTLRALLEAAGEGDVTSKIVAAPAESSLPPTPSEESERTWVARWGEAAVTLDAIRLARGIPEVQQGLARCQRVGVARVQATLIAAETLIGLGAVHEAAALLDQLPAVPALPAPAQLRRTQLRALAASLSGDDAFAKAMLKTLPADTESLGILGGVLKRRWRDTGERRSLQASYDAYRAANAPREDHYPTVNLAALSLQLGDRQQSAVLAKRALELVDAERSPSRWALASRAEALLLLGRTDEARVAYRTAADGAGARDVAVMRRQARLDLRALEQDEHALDAELSPGAVACVLSARLDGAEWTPARMSAARRQLEALVRERGVVLGFCSAARGAELLFADILRGRQATATVFVPAPRTSFEEEFVGPEWAPLLRGVPERHLVVLPAATPGAGLFQACDDASTRAALELCAVLDDPPLLVALPPRPGAADARGVRAAMSGWAARGGGEVVEVPLP